MEEDTEYLKLPVEDRCVHKLWKARLNGYEEAGKLFNKIDDEKSPEWNKFLGLIKKFVIDSNAVAQEKGLEATLAFVENCGNAGKTASDVVASIIAKSIAAPKTKTRELSLQIILMYVEIEKHEAVQEELMKGMDHKNPKIVAECISAVTTALREFGPKVINIKPLVKKMPALLEDRDKTVRENGKALVIEMHRWIGAALKPQLSSLKPIQVTELEAEFEKYKDEKAVPTRYLRSQQAKQAKAAAEAAEAGEDGEDEDDTDAAVEIDPYEMMPAVDILSKLPSGFFEKVEAKKWQERKEAVDELDSLLQKSPKLESGDYGDLVRALKKIISKDSNVIVVTVAGKCLASLANGLKKRFSPYASACIPALLEKFREKKATVVAAIRDAIDGVYLSTNIENIQEDVLAALENKNPSVKAETAAFLARCFTKCTAIMLNKKLLKSYSAALIKALNEPDPSVRDNAAEALGTALKVVGEKALMPFVSDVDNLKMAKIRECCEKAVIVAKPAKAAAERPSTAPAKGARGNDAPPATQAGSTAPKPVKRPATSGGPVRKPAPSAAAPAAKRVASKNVKESKLPQEKDLSPEEIDEKASELFSSEILNGLQDSVWKNRLAAVEELDKAIRMMDKGDAQTQVLIRTLHKKPGLKDTNFQVLKAKLEVVKYIAENFTLTTTTTTYILTDVAEKLGDAKNGTVSAEVLTALAEATKLDHVATEVIDYSFNKQKSPKVQQEALNWLSQALLEFGFVVQPKGLIENIKKALSATNPAVKTTAISLLGTLYLFMGPQLAMFFDSEKPTLVQQINAEFEKLNSALISELADKNWKVRNEALQKITNILAEARFITGNLGELPPVLAQRLVDSNAKIAATAITICQTLATAMGSACRQHTRTFFPGLLQCMGDSKQWIRSSAVTCINTFGEQGGFKEFFEGEMIADALKTGSPALRVELWNWLSERLPQIKTVSKDELVVCLPYLYSNLEDRNADVRKNAQEATLGIMIHVGYESMLKATSSLKPGSRNVVVQNLDKMRANLPAKPAPAKSKALSASHSDDQLAIKSGPKIKSPNSKIATISSGTKTITKSKPGSATKASSRKKDEDIDTSPLVQVNNLKHQRCIDEQKLKVLKWNFITPRDEFVELLRDQMTTANFNKNLMANMFHSDFKYHLKAIDMLIEDLPDNGKALTCNLDLILKWMTLRFFDTNPSVLLKGLEYLQTVFNMLIEDSYSMLETEAASFIPYLILKVGDPKDAVRHSVRALFKLIGQVYSVTRLFAHIMEGLKSKNARQRTECLEELGYLIETYGITVCVPSAAAALKEVAKQISDRDNAVRNAALNCVVQAYFIEGEKVYKMVGNISDKDMSLLEERIKRAGKNKPAARPSINPVRPSLAPLSQPTPVSPPRMKQEVKEETPEPDEEEEEAIESEEPVPEVKPRPVSGPFGLDMDFIQRMETEKPTCNAPKLINVDLSDIIEGSENVKDCLPVLKGNCNRETPSLVMNALNIQNSPKLSPLPDVLKDFNLARLQKQSQPRDPVEDVLDRAISLIAGPDMDKCKDTLIQVEHVMRSDRVNVLVPRVDQFMSSCITQLRTVTLCNTVYSKEEQTMVLRAIFGSLHTFYSQPLLARQVTMADLRESVYVMVRMLAEKRLDGLSDIDNFVQIVNILVMVIIDKAEHTRITCALLKLLHESVEKGEQWPAKMQELIMKCIWKVVRSFPSWEPDIDYDPIMYDIHCFLQSYPTRMWKHSQSDVPLRTVKTLLHAMVKQRGNKVLHHMKCISEPADSELPIYVNKFIKTVKQDDQKSKDDKSSSQQRLSKDTHDILGAIFKKIGSKEHTQEGLQLLYEFKEKHSDVSIEPFLQKSTQFFQDYIQRNLQAIELERRRQAGSSPATARPGVSTTVKPLVDNASSVADKEDAKDAKYYLERLRTLQQCAGFDEVSNATPAAAGREEYTMDLERQLGLDQNLNFNSATGNTNEQFTSSSPRSELSNREALRRRLEEVKSSAR
ncbi:Protein mini spindles [Frankliniella fusca]|uniref:Protein mini spindles n=1 Tax=Frankliniella fusca TaxID=407009 RepID=A0AAE1HLX7_9NEOP|nr:Protein mini spindles [Frankliniella fusca]